MARYRQWSTEDTRVALNWISGKMLGGAIWRDSADTDENRLDTLKGLIDQPELFAAKMKSWLKADAWKKLQGTLRQRELAAKKAQSGDESATAASDDQPAESCASCLRLKAEIENLHVQIDGYKRFQATTEKASDAWIGILGKAEQGDVQALVEFLQLTLPAASMAAMRAAFGGDHQMDDDHQADHLENEFHVEHQELKNDLHQDDDHLENQADDGNQADDDLSALQIAAIALARQQMEQGELLGQAARTAYSKIRSALPELSCDQATTIAVFNIQRMMSTFADQAIPMPTKDTRDEAIRILCKAKMPQRAISSALGISKGAIYKANKRSKAA